MGRAKIISGSNPYTIEIQYDNTEYNNNVVFVSDKIRTTNERVAVLQGEIVPLIIMAHQLNQQLNTITLSMVGKEDKTSLQAELDEVAVEFAKISDKLAAKQSELRIAQMESLAWGKTSEYLKRYPASEKKQRESIWSIDFNRVPLAGEVGTIEIQGVTGSDSSKIDQYQKDITANISELASIYTEVDGLSVNIYNTQVELDNTSAEIGRLKRKLQFLNSLLNPEEMQDLEKVKQLEETKAKKEIEKSDKGLELNDLEQQKYEKTNELYDLIDRESTLMNELNALYLELEEAVDPQEIARLQAEIISKQDDLGSIPEEKQGIENEIEQLNNQINDKQKEIDDLDEVINDLNREIQFYRDQSGFVDKEEIKSRIESTERLLSSTVDSFNSILETREQFLSDKEDKLEGVKDIEDENLELFKRIQEIYTSEIYIQPSRIAQYDKARDGRITSAISMSAIGCWYCYALLPGWEKWKPTYRTGTILSIQDSVCTIELDPRFSRVQNLNINQTSALSAVPFDYPHCNDTAFKASDKVIVKFKDQDWGNPVVVGFTQNPKKCSLPDYSYEEYFIGDDFHGWDIHTSTGEYYTCGKIELVERNEWIPDEEGPDGEDTVRRVVIGLEVTKAPWKLAEFLLDDKRVAMMISDVRESFEAAYYDSLYSGYSGWTRDVRMIQAYEYISYVYENYNTPLVFYLPNYYCDDEDKGGTPVHGSIISELREYPGARYNYYLNYYRNDSSEFSMVYSGFYPLICCVEESSINFIQNEKLILKGKEDKPLTPPYFSADNRLVVCDFRLEFPVMIKKYREYDYNEETGENYEVDPIKSFSFWMNQLQLILQSFQWSRAYADFSGYRDETPLPPCPGFNKRQAIDDIEQEYRYRVNEWGEGTFLAHASYFSYSIPTASEPSHRLHTSNDTFWPPLGKSEFSVTFCRKPIPFKTSYFRSRFNGEYSGWKIRCVDAPEDESLLEKWTYPFESQLPKDMRVFEKCTFFPTIHVAWLSNTSYETVLHSFSVVCLAPHGFRDIPLPSLNKSIPQFVFTFSILNLEKEEKIRFYSPSLAYTSEKEPKINIITFNKIETPSIQEVQFLTENLLDIREEDEFSYKIVSAVDTVLDLVESELTIPVIQSTVSYAKSFSLVFSPNFRLCATAVLEEVDVEDDGVKYTSEICPQFSGIPCFSEGIAYSKTQEDEPPTFKFIDYFGYVFAEILPMNQKVISKGYHSESISIQLISSMLYRYEEMEFNFVSYNNIFYSEKPLSLNKIIYLGWLERIIPTQLKNQISVITLNPDTLPPLTGKISGYNTSESCAYCKGYGYPLTFEKTSDYLNPDSSYVLPNIELLMKNLKIYSL